MHTHVSPWQQDSDRCCDAFFRCQTNRLRVCICCGPQRDDCHCCECSRKCAKLPCCCCCKKGKVTSGAALSMDECCECDCIENSCGSRCVSDGRHPCRPRLRSRLGASARRPTHGASLIRRSGAVVMRFAVCRYAGCQPPCLCCHVTCLSCPTCWDCPNCCCCHEEVGTMPSRPPFLCRGPPLPALSTPIPPSSRTPLCPARARARTHTHGRLPALHLVNVCCLHMHTHRSCTWTAT